ncbi:hypothetical protein ACJZ2D_002799 [Fusarium nematophilum]
MIGRGATAKKALSCSQSLGLLFSYQLQTKLPQTLFLFLIEGPWSVAIINWGGILRSWRANLAVFKVYAALTFQPPSHRGKNGGNRSLLYAFQDPLYFETRKQRFRLLTQVLTDRRLDPAGIKGEAMHALGAVESLDLIHHVDVGRFGLAVGKIGVVLVLEIDIIEMDRALVVFRSC